jgi:DNA helicase HerA-like ATPase
LQKIEQVVRLIRSKGVGVYFITQNPIDVPDKVLGQMGNRVQHALRAFTPRDQKAVDASADTFRPNPKLDVREVITQLGVGEALVSLLQDDGTPGIVERTLIRPPSSRIGSITPDERKAVLASSPIRGVYDQAMDRESAYELLKKRAAASADSAEKAPEEVPVPSAPAPAERPARRRSDTPIEAMTKSVVRGMGGQLGRSIVRGIFGNLFGGRRR